MSKNSPVLKTFAKMSEYEMTMKRQGTSPPKAATMGMKLLPSLSTKINIVKSMNGGQGKCPPRAATTV